MLGKDLKKEEIIFVDDKKSNVEAAIKFGLKGIQFDHLKESGADLKAKLAHFGVVVKWKENFVLCGGKNYIIIFHFCK